MILTGPSTVRLKIDFPQATYFSVKIRFRGFSLI